MPAVVWVGGGLLLIALGFWGLLFVGPSGEPERYDGSGNRCEHLEQINTLLASIQGSSWVSRCSCIRAYPVTSDDGHPSDEEAATTKQEPCCPVCYRDTHMAPAKRDSILH